MGLQWSGLLGITHMPHFGHSIEENIFVRQIFSRFHGGYLWLDEKVPVMIDLIPQITQLPMAWVDLLHYLNDKDNDNQLTTMLGKEI